MALTDDCDLFLGLHENGINRVFDHVRRQRPALFNYATAEIAGNRELWCADVVFTPDVLQHNNPLFTVMNPLPVFGADSPPVGIGFCAQVTKTRVDFHPGNAIALPAEMHPPLAEQHFSVVLRICAAIACPDPRIIDRIPPPDKAFGGNLTYDAPRDKPPTPIVLPGRTNCFCLDVFAIGHVQRQFISGRESLLVKVDEVDIVDLAPPGLKQNLICYLKTSLNVVLREKMAIALQTLMFSFPLFGFGTVNLFPTPNPPLPNNPAISDDELKVFITMKVI